MGVRIITGDCRDVLRTLSDESVHCVVTSPPYFGLRDYGCVGQVGLEATPDAFVAVIASIFEDVRRVLRTDGTAWLNLGDSYAGSGGLGVQSGKEFEYRFRGQEIVCRSARAKPCGVLKAKDLIGIPWRVAFALQACGWYLRQDIIWSKPNPMPESVTDRCTKAHEYLFLLSKSERYYYDNDAIAETSLRAGDIPKGSHKHTSDSVNDGRIRQGLAAHSLTPVAATRNKRSVWEVATQPFSASHFATFPPGLIEPCIKAGCPTGGVVLDPFGGAGTTGLVADRLQRSAILIELNPDYAAMAQRRLNNEGGMFSNVSAERKENENERPKAAKQGVML